MMGRGLPWLFALLFMFNCLGKEPAGKSEEHSNAKSSKPDLNQETGLIGKKKEPPKSIPSHGQVKYIDLGDGITLEMIYIEAGSFEMGLVDTYTFVNDVNFQSHVMPLHEVALDSFLIGKYEVTQEQYKAVMNYNLSMFKAKNNPVECVSWNDAVEFCNKLSTMTGNTFSLPTEAQWEYACRAGTTTLYCFGDDTSQLHHYCNYCAKLCEFKWKDERYRDDCLYTSYVGVFEPNRWGLYDMHGNVYEWCSDFYGKDYYKHSPKCNPTGPSSGSDRVLRGGSWLSMKQNCHSSDRHHSIPEFSYYAVGFRVVMVE